MSKVLVVEDNEAAVHQIRDYLELQRYIVEIALDGREGLERLLHYPFDVAVIDWELPHACGIELVQQYRHGGGKKPVLMLTGRATTNDKEQGLDCGSDDYLTKPFEMRELGARLRALLRRPSEIRSSLTAGDLSLDLSSGQLLRQGHTIKLKPTEYALLEYFMRHPGELIATDKLLGHVWKSESEATENAVRTYVSRLRGKIRSGDKGPRIESVYGLGYRFHSE